MVVVMDSKWVAWMVKKTAPKMVDLKGCCLVVWMVALMVLRRVVH